MNQRQLYRHKRTKRARVKRLLRKRATRKRDALTLLVLKKRDVRSSMTAWDNERPEVRHGGAGLSRVDIMAAWACLVLTDLFACLEFIATSLLACVPARRST